MEIVTGSTGRTHVTPIDDAIRNGNVGYVTEEVVLDVYTDNAQSDNFTATKYNNNTVRVGRGYGMMQGRLFKILDNSYDDVNIVNGTQGKKRADLIVAHYEMDSSTGFETITLEAIQGAAGSSYVDPEYTTGNINQGDTENDMPLYRVKLDGIQIEEVEQLFTLVPDGGRVGVIEKKIESDLITDLARETAGNLSDTGTEIGVKGLLPITHGGTGSNAAAGARDNLGLKALATKDKAALGSDVSGTLPIGNGGTGQTTAAGIRNALGLGNTTDALPIANGGTGSTTAAAARTALGLKALATKDKAALGSDVSGTLPVSNGGTGKASVTSGKALVGNGTNALQEWDIDTAPNSGHNQALITSKAVADALGQAGHGDMLKSTYDSDNDGAIDVAAGGTGAKTPADARENLGLGSVATENTVPVSNGGTGATNAETARANLHVPTMDKVTDNAPYLIRKSKGNLADIVLEGYSLPVNQIQNFDASKTDRGVTATFNSSTGVVSLSNSVTTSYTVIFPEIYVIKGHKYLLRTNLLTNPNNLTFRIGSLNTPVNMTVSGTGLQEVTLDYNGASDQTRTSSSGIQSVSANTDLSGITFQFNIVDITQKFGTDIADHIYSKEQASAGSGIAWIKSFGFFSKLYEPYNLGSIQSVKPSGRKIVGFNQWDGTLGNGYVSDSDGELKETNNSLNKNTGYISVIPNIQYYIKDDAANGLWGAWYDADKNFITGITLSQIPSKIVTSPSNARYIRFTVSYRNSTYNSPETFCINISDTTKNGTYEPYTSTTVALPNEDLRGILKRDGDNLYAYGDTDDGSGNKNVRFKIVDLGAQNWAYQSSSGNMYVDNVVSDRATGNATKVIAVCGRYLEHIGDIGGVSGLVSDKTFAFQDTMMGRIIVRDTAYTDAATFKTAMDGVYLVYPLATPTTESTTPWQNPQRAYLDGTEEFIDNREVPLPVGNTSKYQLNETLPPIEDYVDGAVKNINYRQPDMTYTVTSQTAGSAMLAIGAMAIPFDKLTMFSKIVINHADGGKRVFGYSAYNELIATKSWTFREIYDMLFGSASGFMGCLAITLERNSNGTAGNMNGIVWTSISYDYSNHNLDFNTNFTEYTLATGDIVEVYF